MMIQEVLSRFQKVKSRGNGAYMALCPAHDDHKSSLSITDKGDKILLHCHAGCSTEDVLSIAGLTKGDLFSGGIASHPGSAKQLIAVYDYHDASGTVIARKQRYADKSFYWQRPNGAGGWSGGLSGLKTPPYNLPEVQGAPLVYLVEGEKDADRLNSLGRVATTVPNGANWNQQYAQWFREKSVIILPDNDKPGMKFAREAADSLLPVAASVKLLDLKALHLGLMEHGDISDILAERKDDAGVLAELDALVEATPEYTATPKAAFGFRPLAEIQSQRPEYLFEPYVPKGTVTLLAGTSGVGKTWLALKMASNLSLGAPLFDDSVREHEPGNTLYFSLENSLSHVIRPRLEMMGADLGHIIVPEGAAAHRTLDSPALEQHIRDTGAELVIFDPVQSYIGSGVDFHRANEMRPILDKLGGVCTRTGCSIILISHLNKRDSSHALDRIMGSSDLRNYARSILLVGFESGAEEAPVVVHAKNSMGLAGESIRYHIDSARGVILDDFCDVSADDILLNPSGQKARRAAPAMEEAKRLLESLFSTMPYVLLDDVKEAVSRDGKTSMPTVYKAKKDMGVQELYGGFQRKQTWWIAPGADRQAVTEQIRSAEMEVSPADEA